MRGNSLKMSMETKEKRDRDVGEWLTGSNNIMVYSYIIVVLWKRVGCFQPTLLSIVSSAPWAVCYRYSPIPPSWRPFISPHLFLPSAPHFTRLALTCLPPPPKSSIPHLSPRFPPPSRSHPFSATPLSSSVFEQRKKCDPHRSCRGHRLIMTRSRETSGTPPPPRKRG